MSCTWALAFRTIASSPRAAVASSIPPDFRMFAHPYTALSGVRSSWDNTARNSSLARLAASASARASCSRARRTMRSRSSRFRPLMSRAIFETPMISPVVERTGDTVREMSTIVPSLRTRTVSKSLMALPCRIRASTSSSSCKRSGGMMIVMDRPTASAAVYPNSFSAAGFQDRMIPPRSLLTMASAEERTRAVRWNDASSPCFLSVMSCR